MQFFQRLRRRKSSTIRRRLSGAASARARLRVQELEARITPSLITTSFVAPYGQDCYDTLLMDSSGNLYGTAANGGASGDGTVFELVHGSGTLTTLAAFNGSKGANPHASLIMDSSGNLYGTTANGGAANDGTVFELAAGSGTITTLATFTGANGANPEAGLVIDPSGNLYGTTANGGAANDGTVFELAAGSGTLTTLASFNGTNGTNPLGVLIQDSSGNLYGTTNLGGASNEGTVFELAAGSGSITTLASFKTVKGKKGSSQPQGSQPEAGLIMDSSGNLYGTASHGGAFFNAGTVFEVVRGSGTITALASFYDLTTGANPLGSLVMDASGNLYGTTENGPIVNGATQDGSVFELAKGSSTLTTLASFNGVNGANPLAGLVMDASGNLYGTTQGHPGMVFELAPGSRTLTRLARFAYPSGSGPLAGVVMDSIGNLYGTAGGGAFNDGTVFELAAGSGTITALASFNGANGSQPEADMVMDSSGNLYGTTRYGGPGSTGGPSGYGTVFEVAAGSGTITTLASFNGTNGGGPLTGLLMDSSGNLFGATTTGGASNDGTVFEVVHGSGAITTLASFGGGNETEPVGNLLMDGMGNLYGTTVGASDSGDGAVFELAAGSSSITTLASFNGTNGTYPQGGLVIDSHGNLYGTTSSGGTSGDGTIFEVVAGSGTITTLVSFSGSNGSFCQGGLITDSSGNLYGTTDLGGTANNGTVFELPAGSRTVTVLASFNGSNGQNPVCSLLLDSSGNLYGTTTGGGSSGLGTVFELTAASAPLTATAAGPSSVAAGQSLTANASGSADAHTTDAANDPALTSAAGAVLQPGAASPGTNGGSVSPGVPLPSGGMGQTAGRTDGWLPAPAGAGSGGSLGVQSAGDVLAGSAASSPDDLQAVLVDRVFAGFAAPVADL
jgi:uncharacterized repeat protein (TIGR03803 family)